MELFVANLPGSMAAHTLAELFRKFDKEVRFRLVEARAVDGRRFHYGIAGFSSRRAAEKTIRKLHRYPCDGRLLEVREYFHRSYANDRRALDWRTRPWAGEERRKGTRRILSVAPPADEFPSSIEPPKKGRRNGEQLRILGISGYSQLARKLR